MQAQAPRWRWVLIWLAQGKKKSLPLPSNSAAACYMFI
jgi:hypothetical protein